jgi:hypothetical protein
MVYPPGQGKSGEYLMRLWRQYLEEYAASEDQVERQIIGAAYRSAEILGFLAERLDQDGKHRDELTQRTGIFKEAAGRAENLEDCLITATFSLYNFFNTLGHQFASGSPEADGLIREIDQQVHTRTVSAGQVERAAAALEAAFPLLSIMSLALDPVGEMTDAIRQVEQRFAEASARVASPSERLVNALYRIVEMMQLFTVLSDADLRSQVEQIASRFEEEDQAPELKYKLRNGFCRLFELSHLVTTQLDEVL